MHSDNTLLANARQLAKDWSIGNASVVYTLSPLSHNLGFGAQVMALAMGAELVINDLPRGASLADRILETDTSFLVGVPPNAIDLLAEMQKRGLKGLGRLTGFRISGSAVPSEVVAGLIAQGIRPQSGYGMTENCSHQYTLPDDDPRADHRDLRQDLPGLRASHLQGRRSRHRSGAGRGRPDRRPRRQPDARLFRRPGRDRGRLQQERLVHDRRSRLARRAAAICASPAAARTSSSAAATTSIRRGSRSWRRGIRPCSAPPRCR